MVFEQSIASVLEPLRTLYPPAGITLVGAGNGAGAWVYLLRNWQHKQPELEAKPTQAMPQITLIEADDRAFKTLQQAIPAEAGWHVLHATIAAGSCQLPFFIASNSVESGLLNPKTLQHLQPNLHALSVHTHQVRSLPAIWLQQGITPKSHWLIIDCLPALPILDGLSEAELEQVNLIIARVLMPYPKSHNNFPEGTSLVEIDNVLKERGFKIVAVEPGRHPAVGYALFVRDPSVSLLMIADLQEKNYLEVSELKEEIENWKKKVNEKTLQLESLINNKRRIIDVDQQEQVNNLLELNLQIESKLENLHQMNKSLQIDLRNGFANSVKQVESFISMVDYFSTGNRFSNFHGWAVSPDIGLFLIDKVRENKYDLIIEFGSGLSTELLSRAIKMESELSIGSNEAAHFDEREKILSFDHKSEFYEKSMRNLSSQKISNLVKLVHAPLVGWKDETGEYLYYDCENFLSNFSGRLALSDEVRVLLFIDGPPASSCVNARYPAVPLVFKYFSQCQIDIILDDSNRLEEKGVIELWRAFWTRNSLNYDDVNIASEKGIYFSKYRPN